MAAVIQPTSQKLWVNGYPGMEIDLGDGAPVFSEEEFLDFCRRNPDARIERNSDGEIEVMAPTFTETGRTNSNLFGFVWIWARSNGTGKAFDSSTGFTLPNGALRSPDVSWVSSKRWNALSDEGRAGFANICPDFVIELRSESDTLAKLRAKMEEYIANGARLGWLIDPVARRVHVYRPDAEVETLENPREISGELVLPEFSLDMSEIWA